MGSVWVCRLVGASADRVGGWMGVVWVYHLVGVSVDCVGGRMGRWVRFWCGVW